MSVDAAAAPVRQWRRLLRECAAWMLVAGCLVLIGTLVVAGERTTPYQDLVNAVAEGDVDEVRIDDRGQVHWRTRLVPRVAEAPRRAARELSRIDPELRVTQVTGADDRAGIGDWELPAWTGPLGLVLGLCTLVQLVLGPAPWRATRWAWFWLMCGTSLAGALAFLLLGGATGRWRPARPDRRLSGGVAFLLVLVATMALSATWGAL